MARSGTGSWAAAYHSATKHTPSSVRTRGWQLDWDNRPAPFKRYPGRETVALPEPRPVAGRSALEAIATVTVDEPRGGLDLAGLARLLAFGAGVARGRVFPGGDVFYFRTYACAGALYPVEVYVCCGDLDGLAAGVYHFDPLNTALVRLRRGDHRAHLVRATGVEPAMAAAPAALVLTGIPWRTTWKYTQRGYRHLFWDAGMILANLTALAAAARVPTRAVTGFADSEIEALLRLDGRREFPLCLLSLGVGPRVEPAPEPARAEAFESPPLSRREVEFPEILAVNDAGRLPSGAAVASWREGRGLPRAEEVAPPGAADDSIEAVIVRRGSARAFRPGAVPAGVLADILARATRGVATDIVPNGSRLVRPYLVAHDLGGLEPGAYVFERGALRLLRGGRFRQEAAFLCLEQLLGGTGAATHFLMADLAGVLGVYGDRGYRAAQLEAGVVAGRIYLGAYAHRLGATGLTFYDDEVTAFFSPDAAGLSCLLVVAVGESTRLLAEVP